MAENKKLITVAEAAEILGRSKSAIYAALNASPPRLHYQDVRRRLLLRAGLEERFSRSTRPRIDKPQAKAQEPVLKPPASNDKWQALAETANEILDCSQWGPPPWSGEEWAVLAGTIEIGLEEVNTTYTQTI